MSYSIGTALPAIACRANMAQDSEITEPPMSPMKERLSRALGRHITGGGSRYSSLGGSTDMAALQARPSLAKTMSEVYGSIQRGVSEAGSGIVRAISNSVSRLSSVGSGYQRMLNDEDGILLEGAAEVTEGAEQLELQQLDLHQITPELGRGEAALAGEEGFNNATLQRGSSTVGAPVPFRSSFSGTTPSQAAVIAQQLAGTTAAAGCGSSARPDSDAGPMPRLARIRTRTSMAAAADGRSSSSEGGRQPGGPGLTRLRADSNSSSAQSTGGGGLPGHAVMSAPHTLGLSPPAAAAPAPTPGWRTRADYQAELQSANNPVLPAHLLEQLRGWKSPSDPGVVAGQRLRHQLGLPEFVSTPLAEQEPNTR